MKKLKLGKFHQVKENYHRLRNTDIQNINIEIQTLNVEIYISMKLFKYTLLNFLVNKIFCVDVIN